MYTSAEYGSNLYDTCTYDAYNTSDYISKKQYTPKQITLPLVILHHLVEDYTCITKAQQKRTGGAIKSLVNPLKGHLLKLGNEAHVIGRIRPWPSCGVSAKTVGQG